MFDILCYTFHTMNSLEVRPEHVNALRAVDLRLAFGNHGYIDYIPSVGTAVLAVTDEEYEIAHDFVQDLHVERGDVFTQEGVAHNGSSPGQSLFSALEWHIGAHKYIESDVFAALQQFDKQYKDQSASFPENSFSTIWNNLRSLPLSSGNRPSSLRSRTCCCQAHTQLLRRHVCRRLPEMGRVCGKSNKTNTQTGLRSCLLLYAANI